MDTKELYGVLLGLSEPWTVERVELDVPGQEVGVFVTHPRPRHGFAARAVSASSPCLTTWPSGAGATWTAVSS